MYGFYCFHGVVLANRDGILTFKTNVIRLISDFITSAKKTLATATSACRGQGNNQSMLVLLMRPGKLRQWSRSMSPKGDMQSPTCRLLLQTVVKNCHTPTLKHTAGCIIWCYIEGEIIHSA
jgi:hypothetical protein